MYNEEIELVNNAILKEIKKPSFIMTKEYRKQKLKPIIIKNKVQIDNFIKQSDDSFIVFVPIENKNFYYTYFFEINNFSKVGFVDITPGVNISYTVCSDVLKVEDLCNFTKLIPHKTHKIGDIMRKDIKYKYNSVTFKTNSQQTSIIIR